MAELKITKLTVNPSEQLVIEVDDGQGGTTGLAFVLDLEINPEFSKSSIEVRMTVHSPQRCLTGACRNAIFHDVITPEDELEERQANDAHEASDSAELSRMDFLDALTEVFGDKVQMFTVDEKGIHLVTGKPPKH